MEDKTIESITNAKVSAIENSQDKKIIYKNKTCRVLNYDTILKILDIEFDGIGLRIHDVKGRVKDTDTVTIKYLGTIGKPNFKFVL